MPPRPEAASIHVGLAGAGPVFGSPCGCDISEKIATAILRFTSDPTHHKPREERGESHTAQANAAPRPATALTARQRLARNAPRSRLLLTAVLKPKVFFGGGRYRAVATPRLRQLPDLH